jgi:hypothetical protein
MYLHDLNHESDLCSAASPQDRLAPVSEALGRMNHVPTTRDSSCLTTKPASLLPLSLSHRSIQAEPVTNRTSNRRSKSPAHTPISCALEVLSLPRRNQTSQRPYSPRHLGQEPARTKFSVVVGDGCTGRMSPGGEGLGCGHLHIPLSGRRREDGD